MFSVEQLVFMATHLFTVPSHKLSQVQFTNTPLLLIKRSRLSQIRPQLHKGEAKGTAATGPQF